MADQLYPISFMGKTIIVDKNVEADFTGGEGPIAAAHLKLKEREVFFDVGSAWAMWTLYGLALGGYVYSFEPSDVHFENVVKYVEANSEDFILRCKALRIALDSTNHIQTLADWYTAHGWHGELTPDCFVPVAHRTIDSFLPELSALDWMKIDVEGGELDVLLGGLNAIRKFKPNMIIENHLGVDQIGLWMKQNKIYEKMLELLNMFDYKISEVPHQGRSFIIALK